MQPDFDWLESYPACVTICDREANIIFMNQASRQNFARHGGGDLIGQSLYACHSIRSCELIREMLARQTGRTYLTARKGKKRLVHQAPWFRDGRFGGLVETIIDLEPDFQAP